MNPALSDLKTFRAELHIHTTLSPCASVEMIPPLIISAAQAKGINLIAITDHNAIANVNAVMEAAIGTEIIVLPGIELQTREEVHSICIFDSLAQIENFYSEVEKTLPDVQNNADFFGEQFIVDKTGKFIRREKRLLIISSALSLSDAFSLVNKNGGLLIPAHVNRSVYGLLPVLGFIPEDIELLCVEISRHLNTHQAIEKFPQLANIPIIQNGDAHNLADITGFNIFKIKEPTISELKLAISDSQGRKHSIITEM